jgi:hypothetical protein
VELPSRKERFSTSVGDRASRMTMANRPNKSAEMQALANKSSTSGRVSILAWR